MVVHLEDIELLKKQHTEWDNLLKKEEKHPAQNSILTQYYKKHKLKIKEEIQKMENELFEGA